MSPSARRESFSQRRAHQEVMALLKHMHEHQLEIKQELRKIMTAIDDLKREVSETLTEVDSAVDELQTLVDQIINNPGDATAVADAAAQLDALQTKLKTAVQAAKDATAPKP